MLVRDNAPWHVSREVRARIGAHDRRVEAAGSGCRLPSESPRLNPIEPEGMHGKRAVVEPDRELTAAELRRRLRDHYRRPPVQPLEQEAA